MINFTYGKRLLTILLGVLLCLSIEAPKTWSAVDAYVIYGGKNKTEKKIFLAKLPKEVSVKSYNVDLLAVADYSGKQKALAKFQKASVIVLLLNDPMKILMGSILKPNLIIVQSAMETVKSETLTLYVLSKDFDISPLVKRVKVLEATNHDALKKLKDLESVDVIRVDEKFLDVIQAASVATGTLLGY